MKKQRKYSQQEVDITCAEQQFIGLIHGMNGGFEISVTLAKGMALRFEEWEIVSKHPIFKTINGEKVRKELDEYFEKIRKK